MSALTQDPHHPDTWLIPSIHINGQVIQQPVLLKGVHLQAACPGGHCIIHNPSRHHMRDWPLLWDEHRKVFGRLCPHGHKHPDPDSWGSVDHVDSTCDGCCQRS